MATITKAVKKKEKPEEETEGDQIEALLNEKAFQGLHLGSRSGEEIIKPDIITTGSFLFDEVIGGGYRSSSWSRFYAEPEHGKTAQGLLWGKNWQDYWKAKDERYMVLAYNAEGRMSSDLIQRSGIDTSKDNFRIIDSNNADFIYTMTERLIMNNKENIHYFCIVDSTDACQRSVDKDKNLGESEKIGGTATILSAAGKRLSLLFSLKRHHLYMTSQVRDKMSTGIGGGGKAPSGGWAAKFYSSLTGKIDKHWSDFAIREDPSNDKSKEIGRLVQIKLEKTYNETTGRIVHVPIKYGLVGGVWREYEAMMICEEWRFLTDAGKGRYSFSEAFAQELAENNVPFEPSLHGKKNLRTHFDSNPELVEYVYHKMKTIL
jgi:hypothetical protein